ncbi:ATPase activator [Spatholobus suberectus]|nr:ATPase activator [Spatholobus suberectus]
MVIVRNKKRVSYTYELTLKVKGEWIIQGEKKFAGGHIDVPEFSFGELDDLQMEVRPSEARDILHQDKTRICNDLKLFLQPVREKLLQFEQELRDR